MIDRRSTHRTPVAKQHLVGDPEAAVLVIKEITQARQLSTEIRGPPKTPIGNVARIEIDLEDAVAVSNGLISQPGKEWRTNALQKQKRTYQIAPDFRSASRRDNRRIVEL